MSVTDAHSGPETLRKPADFVITTPECLKRFYDHIRTDNKVKKPSRTIRLAFQLLTKLRSGTVNMVLPDGQKVTFNGSQDGPEGTVIIHNDKAIRRFMTAGHLGFCEAYLAGEWDSPDIATFFEVILINAGEFRKTFSGKAWVRFLSNLIHKTKKNTVRGSRKNIYAHYDLGNDFYKTWLDESMTYSSALFLNDNDSLERAQENKYRKMADALDLKPGMSVLEIGCGWGGFSEYLATNHNVQVTAITISEEQYDYAVQRMRTAGLENRVTILLQDYRMVKGSYDRLASIEMLEAVGEDYWPVFFNRIHDLLEPGGCAVIQTITIGDEHFERYRNHADYIQRYIFPGGMLPSPSALSKQIELAGLQSGTPFSFGRDYARTLNKWNETFQKNWNEIRTMNFDSKFKRLWELYLCYCEAGFRDGTTDVIQIPITKH